MSEQAKATDRWLLKSIGSRLKALRKQKSMSLDKLSRLADVSMRYVLQAEQGQANLSVLKLLDLANALSVDIKVFFENSHIGDLPALVKQKRMLSFLGVRGAGKSSIATALLDRLKLNALEGKATNGQQ
jgi:transcriptional regulator with XRE-family HTH domain